MFVLISSHLFFPNILSFSCSFLKMNFKDFTLLSFVLCRTFTPLTVSVVWFLYFTEFIIGKHQPPFNSWYSVTEYRIYNACYWEHWLKKWYQSIYSNWNFADIHVRELQYVITIVKSVKFSVKSYKYLPLSIFIHFSIILQIVNFNIEKIITANMMNILFGFMGVIFRFHD